jgi:hypothetical protein
MNNNNDWKAALSSEIFREYAKNELNSQAQKKIDDEQQIKQAEIDQLIDLENIAKFEKEVKASPKKLKIIKAWQERFAIDPEYAAKVDKTVVDIVMALDLD